MTIDSRPIWRQLLPDKPSIVMRIRLADDLLYMTIPDAETFAPEAVPHLRAAVEAMRQAAGQ